MVKRKQFAVSVPAISYKDHKVILLFIYFGVNFINYNNIKSMCHGARNKQELFSLASLFLTTSCVYCKLTVLLSKNSPTTTHCSLFTVHCSIQFSQFKLQGGKEIRFTHSPKHSHLNAHIPFMFCLNIQTPYRISFIYIDFSSLIYT